MELNQLKNKALKELAETDNSQLLKKIKIKYLGRSGELTQILRSLKNLPLAKRKKIGWQANSLKEELENLINQKLRQISAKKIFSLDFDVTKPGLQISRGHLHLLSKTLEEICNIFTSMNFGVWEGPEIETEYYNFDALNIPANHPARDMWDTFWLKPTYNKQLITNNSYKSPVISHKLLLRTHTSPMQIRYMEKHQPPFQIIVPGRTFRYEATDAIHEINFYQIEGLMVGKDVSLANFKFIIEEFFKKFFNKNIDFRFRPSYFPFVEPGLEVEIKFGKSGQWLEIMGAGMVHRNVFKAVGYNPLKWQGFAFGLCPERLAMIKHNIPDIRFFYSGDLRFIQQF